MAEPLVSIIIPVFNARKYLSETLTSALNQTWLNIEVIVVDDGSTDDSLEIAKSFKQTRLHIISQHRKGACSARNAGFKIAQGQYIQFLDADDVISTNKIEKQLQLLQYLPGYVGLCTTIYFDNGTDHKAYVPKHEWVAAGSDNPTDFLIRLYAGSTNGQEGGGMIQPNAWLTPREIIDRAGLWNENLSVDDDGEFFCRIILASKGISYAPEAVNYYRKYKHMNNLSAQLNLSGLQSMLKSIDLKQQHLTGSCNHKLVEQIFASHYWNIALMAYPRFKKLSAKAAAKAKEGNYSGRKYTGGPISNILARFLGWKILRYVSYFRYDF